MSPRQLYQMDGQLQDYDPFSCTKTIFSLFDTLEVSCTRLYQDYETNHFDNKRNVQYSKQVIVDVFNHHLGFFSIRAVSLQSGCHGTFADDE